MNLSPRPAPQVSPLWQAVYRQAAAIPSPLSPDQAKRLAHWQAALRAVRAESS